MHDVVNLLLSTGCDDVEEANQVLPNLSKPIPEPHQHITYSLFIAVAPCVELASNILSNDLTEPKLVGSRDIFIDAGDSSKCAGSPIFLDLTEA